MAGGLPALQRGHAVAPHGQRSGGGDLRVELPKRARGRVARVGEGGLTLLRPLLVDAGEAGDREVDLTTNLDQLGRILDPQWDRLDRLQVLRDVLADAAVASRRAAREDTVLVGERDREPVDLRLRDVADLAPGDVEALELALHALRPGAELVLVPRVGEREHRLVVGDLLELVERLAADALRRRVRREQLGMIFFDPSQLAQQVVVVGVGDLRVVEDVVAVVVVGDLPPELLGSLLDGLCGAHLCEEASADGAFSSAVASMPVKSHRLSRSRLGRSVRSKWTGVTEMRSCAIAERSEPRSSSNEGS